MSSPIPAHSTVPHDGWGLGVADDDAIGSGISPPDSINNNFFDQLRPKVYRFQIYWDADEPGNEVFINRARAQISRARAAGAQTIVCTFKRHGATPTASNYEAKIRNVVDALAGDVDVWGPANEPNDGENWLPGLSGARLLADYNTALATVVSQEDPTAQRTSPDFVQPANLQDQVAYINEYIDHGGGWGHYIAYHPYRGVGSKNLSGVTTLAAISPSSKQIWITEVGAHWNNDPSAQNSVVNWMIYGEPGKPPLANYERVTKIFYYHMQGKSGSGWDTALLHSDLKRRPAWYTWCKGSHGDNASHSDCLAPAPAPTASISSSFAMYRGDGIVDVFARGSNGNLWHNYYNPATTWSGWGSSLGAQLTSEPSAITYGNGEIDVYARGLSNQLIVRYYRPSTGWGPWVDLGGQLGSGPSAIHRGGGIVDVFSRGTDGTLQHRAYVPGAGWGPSTSLGAQLTSEPSAITYGNGEIDVYARGLSNQLIVRYYRPSTGWGPWVDLGGQLGSAPSAMYRGAGIVDVFMRGTNGELWHMYYTPGIGWSSWGSLGGQLTSAPGAASHGNGGMDVFGRGTGSQLVLRTFRSGVGWSPWINVTAMP